MEKCYRVLMTWYTLLLPDLIVSYIDNILCDVHCGVGILHSHSIVMIASSNLWQSYFYYTPLVKDWVIGGCRTGPDTARPPRTLNISRIARHQHTMMTLLFFAMPSMCNLVRLVDTLCTYIDYPSLCFFLSCCIRWYIFNFSISW